MNQKARPSHAASAENFLSSESRQDLRAVKLDDFALIGLT
jgi:hypothetical protein